MLAAVGGGGGVQISNRSGEASLRSRHFGKDLRKISGEEQGTSPEESLCLGV